MKVTCFDFSNTQIRRFYMCVGPTFAFHKAVEENSILNYLTTSKSGPYKRRSIAGSSLSKLGPTNEGVFIGAAAANSIPAPINTPSFVGPTFEEDDPAILLRL